MLAKRRRAAAQHDRMNPQRVVLGIDYGPVAAFGFDWPGVGTQYELTRDIPGHPRGSHVSARTLRQAGIQVPRRPRGSAL